MKREMFAVALLIAAFTTTFLFSAYAHEVPYAEIVIGSDPQYAVGIGLGFKTLEERRPVPSGVFGRQWEFFDNGRTTFMTFFRHDPERITSGESFQVVQPKQDTLREDEALEKSRLVDRIICAHRPELADSC